VASVLKRTTETISFKVIISDVVCKLFANIDIVAFPFDSSQLFHGKIIFISRSRLWTSVLILKWATAVVTRIPPITHNHMIGIQALQSAYMFIYKLLYINTYMYMDVRLRIQIWPPLPKRDREDRVTKVGMLTDADACAITYRLYEHPNLCL